MGLRVDVLQEMVTSGRPASMWKESPLQGREGPVKDGQGEGPKMHSCQHFLYPRITLNVSTKRAQQMSR